MHSRCKRIAKLHACNHQVRERDMSTSPLSIDVYVAPMRPYTCPDQLGESEVATWAPSSSTLISGPTEGILIDALLTFENADEIAAWAKSFGKQNDLGSRCATPEWAVRTKSLARQRAPTGFGLPPRRHIRRVEPKRRWEP
jgi:hypothetical protein